VSRVSANEKGFGFKSDFRKLGLDGRAVNALAGHGIFGIEDLAQYTHHEFADLPGVGAETCKVLQHFLKKAVQPPDESSQIAPSALAQVLEAKFKEGDLVELLAGGPIMVVDRVDRTGEGYSCTWFADKKRERSHFRAATLKSAKRPDK
jgi:uncharacterized protein YodC (DUF2158 family)